MFSAVARSSRPLSRRALAQGARWVSQAPPPNPPGDKGGETVFPKSESPAEPELVASAAKPLAPGELPSLDFMPGEPAQESQQTGARSAKDNTLSTEKKRNAFGRVMLALMSVGFGGYVVYMGREWEEDELKPKKLTLETAPSTWWGRVEMRFNGIFDYINEPAWPELLPPPTPPPQGKPYTLVVSLDDLLITSTWDRQHGWRTAKRPGLDYFLAYISQFYEVVVFTSQPSYTAAPILDKLDKFQFFVTYRLYREATRHLNGKIVKDLSLMNRDPSKVIFLDTNPEHVCMQPDNSIILPKWKGERGDKGLVSMIPFLESIAIYRPPDVRPILKAYEGKDIPIEYAKAEAAAKEAHIEKWKQRQPSVSSGFMSGLFGLSSASANPSSGPPPTYLEQKRREAQLHYKQEQKYIADNKEYLEKMLEQEQQAAMAAGPGNLIEAFGQMTGATPPPQQPQPGQLAAPEPTTSTPTPTQS